jgi:Tol biopolymer transport system component
VRRDDGTRGYFRIRLANGDLKEFPTGNGGLDAISPDEKTLYIRRPDAGPPPFRLVALDVASGQERVLASFATAPSIAALSADGRTLAIAWNERLPTDPKLHIFRVAVDGSGSQEVYTGSARLQSGRTIAWDRDGRSILFDQGQGGGHWGVMRVPAEGGAATLATSMVFPGPVPGLQSFALSPDGSRLSYTTYEDTSELWALDNVLPMLK